MPRGFFVLYPDTPMEERIPNTIMDEGADLFLRAIFQSNDIINSVMYMGLMGSSFSREQTLADIAVTEPTIGVNGYARQALSRDALGWPSIAKVNGVYRAQSATVTFTASGGDYDRGIYRAFLCDVASGTAGAILAVGGARSSEFLVTPSNPLPARYEFWWQ